MKNIKDITGQKYGMLTVIKQAPRKDKKIKWICKCECGNETIVSSGDLKNGHTKSCGCLKLKHGKRNTRIYKIWQSMKNRCYYENDICYQNYGGRGITICKEWLDDFQVFYEWAIANGYQENLTIDRIDTNGNYEPTNCRWATMKEQQNNRTTNKLITFNGETKTMKQWAEFVGIPYRRLQDRIASGWDIEKALYTKKRGE